LGRKQLEPAELRLELKKLQNGVVQSNNLERCEEMLATQAMIFNDSMVRAATQDTCKPLTIYLRMGLKAQAQPRTHVLPPLRLSLAVLIDTYFCWVVFTLPHPLRYYFSQRSA
jgi:hypothetical protein